jgi:hypothetical protein
MSGRCIDTGKRIGITIKAERNKKRERERACD